MYHFCNVLVTMVCSHVFSGHLVDSADKLSHCPCAIDVSSQTADLPQSEFNGGS